MRAPGTSPFSKGERKRTVQAGRIAMSVEPRGQKLTDGFRPGVGNDQFAVAHESVIEPESLGVPAVRDLSRREVGEEPGVLRIGFNGAPVPSSAYSRSSFCQVSESFSPRLAAAASCSGVKDAFMLAR